MAKIKSRYQLNPTQLKAVRHKNGPLLIIAGAGTGKTTVITERICHLINSGICKPDEVLALTFTEKASREMEERVDQLMPYGLGELWISTFHSFCDRILKTEGIQIGINPGYSMMNKAEAIALMRRQIHATDFTYFRPLGNPYKFIEAMLDHFDRLRDEDVSTVEYARFAQDYQSGKTDEDRLEKLKLTELSAAFRLYEEAKVRENVFDYADLISYTLKLFRKRPNILKRYRRQFKYILVDEFQDTNYAQNELAIMLARPKNNLTVVGDDDQAIYRFRGAAISNILDFRKRFPKAKAVVLTENYRSTKEILDSSYRLIVQNNPDRLEVVENISKKLVSHRGIGGRKIELLFASRVEDEASEVAKAISRIIEAGEVKVYSDITILVRANDHAEPFTRALARSGIPYQFLGPGQLFRQKEVKDLVSYLVFLTDIHDSVALYRVLTNDVFGLPSRDLAELMTFSRQSGLSLFESLERAVSVFPSDAPADKADIPKVSTEGAGKLHVYYQMVLRHLKAVKKETAGQILYYFLEDTGILARMASYQSVAEERAAINIAKLFNKLKGYEAVHDDASVYAVVDWIKLSMELGESPLAGEVDWTQNNAVNIMSVHSAKGLEFPVVFVVNMVAARFPTRERREQIPVPERLIKETLPQGDAHLEEERRLCYVAMTRAKDQLYFSAAGYYGEGKREKKLSPFIGEALGGDFLVPKAQPLTNSPQLELLDWQKAVTSTASSPKNDGPQRVSYSKLETFATCPLQYKYRYVVSIPVPASAALSFGDTIHRTLYEAYKKIKSGSDIDLDQLLEIFQSAWSPKGYGNKLYEKKMFERGVRILSQFVQTGMRSQGKPIDLEKPFRIKIGKNILVTGKIDRVDELSGGKIEIIDYKTGQSPKAKNPEKDRQLTMYALAATEKSMYGKKPQDVVVSLYFLEDQTKVSATRNAGELEEFRDSVKETVAKISEGDFKPKAGMHCDFCEFRLICEAWK